MATKHDIELNGIKYTCQFDEDEDRVGKRGFSRTFTETQDTQTQRGEHSLSEWWAEKQTDWSEGEDQKLWDNPKASESRFWDSSNADIATPGQVSLLKAVAVSKAAAYSFLPLIVAESKLWLGADTGVYSFDGTTWASIVTVAAAKTVRALEYDGDLLYAALDGANTIYKSNAGITSFSTWSTPTGITAMKYIPSVGRIHAIAGQYFYRLNTDGTAGVTKDFGTGWTLVGIDSYQGSHVIFGAGYDSHYFLYEYDGTGFAEVAELPPGFVLTGLKTLAPDRVLVMGYEDATTSGGGVGSVWEFKGGDLTFLGYIGSDTANKPYGPFCAARWRNEVRIGWNYQSGLYRFDIVRGGLSKNLNISTVNNKVRAVTFFKGKWYYSIESNGVYAEQATYAASGWVKGSLTAFNVSNKKLMKEAVVELVNKGTAGLVLDQACTTIGSSNSAVSTTRWAAQTFTAGASLPLSKVRLRLDKLSGAIGSCTLELQSTSASQPSGTALATTDALSVSQLTTSPEVVELLFSTPYTLTSGTVYALVLKGSQAATTVSWYWVDSNPYANGARWNTTDSGSTWSGGSTSDFYFETYNEGVLAGTIDLDITQDEGSVYTNKGSITSATALLEAISLTNLKADSLGYKITLNTNAAATAVPIVKAITLRGLPILSTRGAWEYWIHADEEVDPDNRTAYALWNNLHTAYNLQQVVTLKDHDFGKTSTVFNVIIDELEEFVIDKTTEGAYERLIRVKLKEAA